MNAFRGQTCEELIHAFGHVGFDSDVGVIVFAGAGDRAFCTGGDQSVHEGQQYDGRGTVGMPVEEMHAAIRDVPVPVIAKVQGYAIGGGNVLGDHLRSNDLWRFGDLRTSRSIHGFGRRRVRHHVPRSRRRREEGSGDLVPSAAAIPDGKPRRWGLPTLAYPTTNSTPPLSSGRKRSARRAPRRLRSPNARSTWTRPTRPESQGWACTRTNLCYGTRRVAGRCQRVQREAQAELPPVRELARLSKRFTSRSDTSSLGLCCELRSSCTCRSS